MAGQQIQQARTLADRGVSQPLIPFAQQDLHFVANRGQLVKLPLESVQALTDQGAHTLAGRDPSVPLAENRRQFLERESDDQRALNEAVPVRRPMADSVDSPHSCAWCRSAIRAARSAEACRC